MPYKQIRVSDKVHKKVKRIADMHYRGIGAQVEYWVENDCTHPVEMREEVTVEIAVPDEAGKVGKGQPVRIFVCRQCGQVIWNGATAELAERVRKLVEG